MILRGVAEATFASRGPQQHAAFRHFDPQLQYLACSTASNPDDTAAAAPVWTQIKPTTKTTAGASQGFRSVRRAFRSSVPTSRTLSNGALQGCSAGWYRLEFSSLRHRLSRVAIHDPNPRHVDDEIRISRISSVTSIHMDRVGWGRRLGGGRGAE